MSEVRVRFKDRELVDNLYENAVDQFQLRARRRNAIILLVVVVVVVGIVVWRCVR